MKPTIFSIFIIIFSSIGLFSQEVLIDAEKTHEELIYQIVEVMPKFSIYEDSLSNYLYLKTKLSGGTKGIVYVKFIIDKTGKIINPEIVKGIDEFTDENALKIVREMPNWIPGKNNGENVNVLYSLPIKF